MFELIRAYQLDIMLLLCGACAILIFLLAMTRFLSKSRKRILILIESIALFLLWFDRLAYIYAGNPGQTGYIMVRVSNFMVFFLTSGIVFGLNLYLRDYLINEGKLRVESLPYRLKISGMGSIIGMVLAVISAFTGLYYYFDETNLYHRGQGFLIAYIIPVLCTIFQYIVIRQYRRIIGKLIYISMALFLFVPVTCGILQIFTYGISIVNMSMVVVSIFLYLFAYVDINNTVEHAHEIEIRGMQGEHERMQRLFDQTVAAFVSAVEKKDESIQGCSARVAECARRIAELSGMNEQECEKVYYAALLHNVGLIGIPDNEIFRNGDDPEKVKEIAARMAVIGNELLSGIKELPCLGIGAYYCHEKYNGEGDPEGLQGENIPEIARIIAVADAYVLMKTDSTFSRNLPDFVVREELFKGEGEDFDPKYAEIMIKLIDAASIKIESEGAYELEKEITCTKYREQISAGIPIEHEITKVAFSCDPIQSDEENIFTAPSIILFDSYDRRVHDNKRAIEAYKYMEYGEIWFDEHSIRAEARKFQETVEKRADGSSSADDTMAYEIRMGRYEDHLKLKMTSPSFEKEVVVALSDGSRSAYIAITGENCKIRNICAEQTDEMVTQDDIPRIVSVTDYIDRMESDVKNIQVDRPRSASTQGIELKDRLKINFHTMSLPGASLVWHCPYIAIFYSDDGLIGGENYREYGLVKIYGENEGDNEFARNSISMKRTDEFSGWDAWKEINKKGMECEVSFRKKNNRVILKTKNQGIEIENVTTITDEPDKVFVALTGDQVAITDIRVR